MNNAPARLLTNTTPMKNWLGVAAPQGSRLELKTPGLPTQVRYVRTDSSYLAASDPRVFFAVASKIGLLTIQVPGRPKQSFGPDEVKINTLFRVPSR